MAGRIGQASTLPSCLNVTAVFGVIFLPLFHTSIKSDSVSIEGFRFETPNNIWSLHVKMYEEISKRQRLAYPPCRRILPLFFL